jgi:Transposase IS66 family/Transposase IS116/IS110/IS902 family
MTESYDGRQVVGIAPPRVRELRELTRYRIKLVRLVLRLPGIGPVLAAAAVAETRGLETMREAGILPSFAGIAVTDRYKGYYSQTWKNFAGRQACAAHLTRDFADCPETYPDAAYALELGEHDLDRASCPRRPSGSWPRRHGKPTAP